MDNRYEAVHQLRNVPEMRRYVIANVNRLLPVASAKLGKVSYGYMVQGPKHILIEGGVILLQANLNAVDQQIMLPSQILFLDPVV